MNTTTPPVPQYARRKRHSYSPEFKAGIVTTSRQPSVSIAAVALPMAPPLPPQPQHVRTDQGSGGMALHRPIAAHHEPARPDTLILGLPWQALFSKLLRDSTL